MSMLSAQIDELREYAARADGTFPLLASALRGAADTIWQMRDDLQRTNAENARLKQELEAVGTAAYLYGRNDLADENAKLRELVREMWAYAEQELLCDENCSYGAVCDWRDCVFKRRMRELGVDV